MTVNLNAELRRADSPTNTASENRGRVFAYGGAPPRDINAMFDMINNRGPIAAEMDDTLAHIREL